MSKATWVLAAIKELRQTDSWTGKIHIQKLLYLYKSIAGADVPFEFRMYHYGPYSAELNDELLDLCLFEVVDKIFRDDRYGASYEINTERGTPEELDPLEQSDTEALAKFAELLGPKRSRDLELIATCHWVSEEEGPQTDDEIINRVREIKPQHDEKTVRRAFSQWQDLLPRLQSVMQSTCRIPDA